ncbi:MAG: hypothetical protein L6R40_007118 [Gallowayella cf. fulva]|nr:MAG: hypothetical protein L6R40_007118 [Xanthomendoza cf. fulva]
MILPTPLLALLSITLFHRPIFAAPIPTDPLPQQQQQQQEIDPKALPFRNEHVLAANKANPPPTPPQHNSFCFRPVVTGLTPQSCLPVVEAIHTLVLAADEPGAPFSKPKTWAATTKSGPIYQWGIPGNPCKIKVVVDPSLGPAVQVTDTFSKEDVQRAARDIVGDCVEGRNQAGRRPVGGKKGMFVTVGRVRKDEKL